MTGDDFVMIPGIEFACEGDLNIVGLGLREYTELRKPNALRSSSGRFMPDDCSQNLLKEFRKHNDSIMAFAGFVVGNDVFRLDPRGEPGPSKSRQIAAARRIYEGAKRVRDSLTRRPPG